MLASVFEIFGVGLGPGGDFRVEAAGLMELAGASGMSVLASGVFEGFSGDRPGAAGRSCPNAGSARRMASNVP